MVRYMVASSDATINRLHLYLDDDGRVIGYNQLFLHRELEIAGKRYSAFHDSTAVLPEYRGKIPVTSDLAGESLRFKIRHPFARALYFGAGSLPGYHFVARHAHVTWPSPRRAIPPEYMAVMAELGRRFYAVEPGSSVTDDPLVIANDLLANRDEHEAWERTHADLRPDLTKLYLQITGNRPDHFALFVVPGTWYNFVMTSLEDWGARLRRALRRRNPLVHARRTEPS
jgi:hypothetical protein